MHTNKYSFKSILLSLIGLITICLGAQANIPFAGNEYLLSDSLSIFWACCLGPYFGAIILSTYLLLGALGLPVFAEGASGIAVLFGNSGGYLFGFLLAAIVSGWLFLKWSGLVKYLALIIGQAIIYFSGVIGLILSTNLSILKIIKIGVIDFLPGGLLKLALIIIFFAIIDTSKSIKVKVF
jgi:biotin transport system substrate-specific component